MKMRLFLFLKFAFISFCFFGLRGLLFPDARLEVNELIIQIFY